MESIRSAHSNDAQAIADIYNHYVAHSTVSFENEKVSIAGMSARIAAIIDRYPWLVCELNDGNHQRIVGFAYAGPYKSRAAYRHSVETTVYLSHEHCRRGAGSLLYRELLRQLEVQNYHTAIAAIALPNAASVRLHEKFGFVNSGILKEVGFKFDHWIDVGYWQRPLNSRIPTLE